MIWSGYKSSRHGPADCKYGQTLFLGNANSQQDLLLASAPTFKLKERPRVAQEGFCYRKVYTLHSDTHC